MQAAIKLPFITDDGINYLVKMRDDTLNFSKLWIGKFFNFSSHQCDPFLIQTSILAKKPKVPGRKNQNTDQDKSKVLIPLSEATIQKAKACQ